MTGKRFARLAAAVAVCLLVLVAFVVQLLGGRGSVPDWQFILGELLTGGLMAGAFFMATDYTTSPITKGGQIIYAVLMGFLTAVFRILGSSAEGVSYAIVISNLAVPLIEKISVPKPFGVRKKEEV